MAADAGREADRPTGTGDEAETDLRQGEGGVARRQDSAGEGGQLDPRAGARAVQVRRGHRSQHRQETGRRPVETDEVRRGRVGPTPHLVEVAAGAERRALAREIDPSHLGVERSDEEGVVQRVAHGGIHGVPDTGPGQDDLEVVLVTTCPQARTVAVGTVAGWTPRSPPGELGSCLEHRVRRRLCDQSGGDGPSLRLPEQQGEGGRGDRVRPHGLGQGIDVGAGPIDHHVDHLQPRTDPAVTSMEVVDRRADRHHHERQAAPLLEVGGRRRRPVQIEQHRAMTVARRCEAVRRGLRANGVDQRAGGDVLDGGNLPWLASMEDDRSPAQRTEEVRRWAASGLMALTGFPDQPALGPPSRLVSGLDVLAGPFEGLDPLPLLAERAGVAGLRRRGTVSCGGAGRLFPAVDGWLAVSLPRPADVDLVPAWLAVDESSVPVPTASAHRSPQATGDPMWDHVARVVVDRGVAELEQRGALLGLAVAGLGAAPAREPVLSTSFGREGRHSTGEPPLVLDLSALWAGPLCGALLADAGSTVVKVESSGRPDGARSGPPAFFDRLNAAKASVLLDLDDREGVRALRRLIDRADVVIESSRPRALRHLGIDAAAILADPSTAPRVWVSITAHGRRGDPSRIGFGDDAAVAGGLVGETASGPVFCADAIADPCTGLAAAAATLGALSSGGRWLLDVALAAVAASLAGPTLPVPAGLTAANPAPSPPSPPAPSLGADTTEVLDRLGARR